MSAAAAYSAATSAGVAFIFLVFAACSPWTMYSLNTVSNAGQTAWYGVGPFVAGAQQSGYFTISGTLWYYGGIVWWNQLNSANTCSLTSPLLSWAQTNGLCDGTNFVMPSQSMGIQACIVLATIFSFFACCTGCSLSKSKAGGGGAAACASFLAMVFSIASFAIWTTWPMSVKLQTSGDFIPVYTAPTVTNPTYSIGLSPVRVTLYYGWTYITTVIAFILLLFSTVTFSAVSKRLADEDSDPFGTGGARAI